MTFRPNTSENETSKVIWVNMTEQFAIYDSLSRPIRRLIDSLPNKTDLRPFPILLERFGEAGTMKIVIGQIEKKYPGWKANTEE